MAAQEMNRTKRNISAVVIIIGAIVISVIKLGIISPNFSKATAFELMPTDVSFIVHTKNLNRAIGQLENNKFWPTISGFESLESFSKTFYAFDSIKNQNELLNELSDGEVFLSFHLIGVDKIKPVFYFAMKKHSINQIVNAVNKFYEGKGTVMERHYESHTIYDAYNRETKNKFSFTVYNQCLMASTSSILIENAVRQINNGHNITDNKGFREVLATAGNATMANIYINHSNIPKVFSVAFNSQKGQNIKNSNKYAEWSELDIMPKNNLMLLNGFSYVSDSLNYVLNILNRQSPQKLVSHQIFPAQTYSFYGILIDDAELFQTNYETFLRKNNSFHTYRSLLDQLKKKYNIDFETTFYKAIYGEMFEFYSNNNPTSLSQDKYFAIQTKGANLNHPPFMDIVKKYAQLNNQNPSNYIYEYKVDEGAAFKIYKFPEADIINTLLGVFFKFETANYFTWINNHIVFAENRKSLEHLIYSNVLNKTMDKGLEYNDFSEFVNTRSNIYYYMKLPRSKKIIDNYLSNTLITVYNNNIEHFNNINTFAYQLSITDNLPYNNITINYIDKTYDIPTTEWETLLDAPISFKPVFVENHYTHNQEIFVQDLNNNIYLINNSGRIIWKQKLDEPINSEIFQVDYYKNNKFQILFSTTSKLHLIDRNGNYVERYPVKLRAEATTGLSLFDYDKNKNYRLFIPCNNKKVYAYTLDGKIITGWNFESTDHYVQTPIQHFRVNHKDYIVFADKFKIYIQDRRGNTRIRPEKQFSKSKNSEFYLNNSDGKYHLVTTDSLGTIYSIYFNGKVENTSVGTFNPSHFFDLNDIDADGKKDYIYVDDGNLRAFSSNKNELFSVSLRKGLNTKPIYFHFSSTDRKLGIVDTKDEKILLINNNGEIYDGFPLIGTSMFSIGILKNNYGKFNLIVGGKNHYLYNYSVN